MVGRPGSSSVPVPAGALAGAYRFLHPTSFLLAVALPAAACGGESPAWHDEDGHRWRELRVRGGEAGFAALPPAETGVDFANRLSEDSLIANEILSHGSGVALGDADADGRVDIYLAGIERPNALYRNLGGWRFEEVTDSAGVALPGRASRGVVFADVEGDGDLDLLVAVHGDRNVLLENDGAGRFRERAEAAGFHRRGASTTMALADVEGDGDLDLYVVNYKRRYARDILPPEVRTSGAFERTRDGIRVRPEYREHYRVVERDGVPQAWEYAEADEFYLNDGRGRFEEQPFTGGTFLDERGEPLDRAPDEWGLAARFHDVDGDGDPDLYVCNDFASPDHFWINQGDGTFRAVARLALRTTSAASMGVDFADIDGDGDVDFFVGEMLSRDPRRRKTQVPEMEAERTGPGDIEERPQVARNTLQLARGDGTWAEVARYAGLEASEWTWGTLFLDVDLDGREDLLVTTGHVHDFLDADTRETRAAAFRGEDWRRARLLFPRLEVEDQAFRNLGDVRFEPAGEAWGFGREAGISHGMAVGDLDGDGDADLVVSRLDDPAVVYRNEAGAPRVAVRLVGERGNARGIGARVTLAAPGSPPQVKELRAGGVYLSGSEPAATFALPSPPDGSGDAGEARLVVAWPGGRRSTVRGVRGNRLYEIRESAATPPAPGSAPPPRPAGAPPTGPDGASPEVRARGGADAPPEAYFRRAELPHRHVETPFPDFRREPLLPLQPSRLGPGLAWEDVDGDGDPDLAIGSGRGGRLALLVNEAGRLRPVRLDVPEAGYDQTTVLGLPGDGPRRLLVGQMSYEAGSGPEAERVASAVVVGSADGRPLSAGVPVRIRPAVPGAPSAAGPLALADLEADGDLDLFVGGRLVPTLYPLPASSRSFRAESGGFVPDTVNAAALARLGLVSAAVFSDVDSDGDPDLLVALEWGPVRLFVNHEGRLSDATADWGLEGHTGRWNGVATGDVDGDGRPDIVATGWGENTDVGASRERPLHLVYGDLDGNGSLDLVEARREAGLEGLRPVARLERLARQLPSLRRRFPTRAAYADASLSELLGPALDEARVERAVTLSHTLFLNRGGRFEPRPLPREAQYAPAFGVLVADLDGDGNEDVFLTQNFFATHPGTARHDAGRSLWLRGDGAGGLEPVPAAVSGIAVYGDPRGAAAADYDGDGRLDLAVTQNGAATHLYRNLGARPGLRVRLSGPPGNPEAVGAALRLAYADGSRGPVREVQAGSGYWSRNGAVQALGRRAGADAVQLGVRWPGGAETVVPLAGVESEVTVAWPGAAVRAGGAR